MKDAPPPEPDPAAPLVKDVVARHADRALSATGAISLLLALGAGGAASLLLPTVAAAGVALAVAGFAGALEVFHRDRKAAAQEQCHLAPAKSNELALRLALDRQWTLKVVRQFGYGGFRFNCIGFEEAPAAVGVSRPLCPACGASVQFTARVRFPGRVRFYAHCHCPAPKPQAQPPAELMQVAIGLSRVPN